MTIDTLNQALGYRSRRITRYVCIQTEDAGIDEISITLTRLASNDITEIMEKVRGMEAVLDVAKPSI